MAQGIPTDKGLVGATVHFEGEKRLVRQLRKLSHEAPKAMKRLHREAAEMLVAPIRARVPHSGDRRGHKKAPGGLARTVRAGSTATAANVRIGSAGVRYAGPIIFGWGERNIAPTLFPYHVLDEYRERIRAMHAVGINRVVEETITRAGVD